MEDVIYLLFEAIMQLHVVEVRGLFHKAWFTVVNYNIAIIIMHMGTSWFHLESEYIGRRGIEKWIKEQENAP